MSTGETWTLGHRPALDGLRGFAVLLVVLAHGHTPGMEAGGGTAGVAVFFTLSGFLITTLLLEERERTGRLDLTRFYQRRALRLLPAMLAVVAVVAGLGVALSAPWFAEPISVIGALFYFANWTVAGGEHLAGALGHLWSLSVEEQFYIVWPVLLPMLLRLGRLVVVAVLLAASLGSLTLRFALLEPGTEWRVYFGTDTRADELLIGCALAVVMRGRVEGRSMPGVAAVAVGGILLTLPSPHWVIFLLLPTFVAILTAVAIFAVAQGEGVRALEWAPLVLIGRRSYALYLWHYPVIIVTETVLGQPAWLLLVAGPVAWGLTLLSWRYIEEPFLRRRSLGAADGSVGGAHRVLRQDA